MHILIEGVTEMTCRRFLLYCIVEMQIFSANDLNKKIRSFDFGHLSRDKPGEIDRIDLADNKPLRQSAAQMIVLAHTLPFLIDEWLTINDDENINKKMDLYILMLQIMNLCLAYEISQESVVLLSRMIEIFISQYTELYPNTMAPKFHFLIHVPEYIKLFGPGRQQWCFRFEAAHAYYKSLISVVRNFKNMPRTMSWRRQANFCSQLSSYPGQSSKTFLYGGDQITVGLSIEALKSPYIQLLNNYIDLTERDTCFVMLSPKIIVYGTTYQKKSTILIECVENNLPIFGEVMDIYVIQNNVLFIVALLETIYFEPKLNAYGVISSRNDPEIRIIELKNLIFPHHLSRFSHRDSQFILLMNCERCEFLG